MNATKLNALVALAIDDAGTNGVPNGHLYAPLMGDVELDEWNVLVACLVQAGMITQHNWLLCITQKGHLLAERIRALERPAAGRCQPVAPSAPVEQPPLKLTGVMHEVGHDEDATNV